MPSLSLKSLLFGAAALVSSSLANTEKVDANMEALKDEARTERFSGLEFLNTRGLHGGLKGFPPVVSFKHQVPPGKIPKVCLDHAQGKLEGTDEPHCTVDQLEVFEVEYNDCPGRTIPICRCANAPMTIDGMAEDLSKVPPKAREWVKSLSARPNRSGQCSAAAGNDHLFFTGDCSNNLAVYLHEVGHALDCAALRSDDADGKPCWSDKDLWRKAVVEEGTCVPDGYAKNVWGDNFAQFSVMAAYHHRVQDVYQNFAGDGGLECMKNALNLAIEVTKDLLAPHVQTCDEGSGFDDNAKEYVCISSEARAQGHCEGIPDLKAPGGDNAETLESAGQFTMSQKDLDIYHGDMAHVWGSGTTSVKRSQVFYA